MKPMKVFLWGERLKDIYPHATKYQVLKYRTMRVVKKIMWLSLLVLALYGALQVGRHYYAVEVMVEKEVSYPVLARIAKCESGGKQFAPNGQVTLNANKDGSIDIGKYQINNKYWGKVASDMGYNLMVEEDNEAFAKFLYTTKGTEVWSASKKCWR